MITSYYKNTSQDLFPNVDPQNGLQKFVQFPLIRLIIVLIFLAPSPLIIGVIKSAFNLYFNDTVVLYLGYVMDVILVGLLVVVYNVYTNAVENRKAHELSLKKFGSELAVGVVLAIIVLSFFVGLIAILGFYQIEEFNSVGNLVFMFFEQMKVGFVEELLFRVVLFKLTEEFVGSWSAIAFQGILFGFAHASNPNATMFSTIALILSFSIFFGAGYMMTRRIWFIMGFHWSWNFFQAGVFGMNNSGASQPSLFSVTVNGPVWLTGGAWGAELSVVNILILFTLSLYFVKIASKNNQFVKPLWRR